MLIIIISHLVLFCFKFDWCLFRNIFLWGLVLCRNQSIYLRCESFDSFLYGAGFCCWCFRTDLIVVYFFVNIYFIIDSNLISQDYWRAQMFLLYLSMAADSVTWRTRVGIFNAFKSQIQVKPNMENPLLFLKIFLFFINYINARLIYFIFFSTFCFLTNVLQVVVVEILFTKY